MSRCLSLMLLVFFSGHHFYGQVNAYAQITAISNGSVLTVANLNQTSDNFSPGKAVIVMQMQGASINTSNNSNFGNLTALNEAGLYEVAEILSVNGATTTITLTRQLMNTYSTADALQLISFPRLGTTAGFATTANITGLAWNGTVGGVIAFSVTGNLTLNHNITADAIGFRGGAKSGQDGGGCESNVWRTSSGNAKYGNKGESVYLTTSAQKAGKAKSANGGGGGIVHNGGGGGGANYTAGGDGYYGYTGSGYCSASASAGGQGGFALTPSSTQIFMGGGGGGGQENNGLGTSGGDGGGIILVKADTIVIAGTCAARSISANGESPGTGSNDGQGGGGAGGTIVLDIKGMRVKTGCPLTVRANGGNGGNVNDGAAHGAGGGGGQGAIFIRATAPFTNVTLQTNNGSGGNATNGGSAPTGSSGSGTSGTGVLSSQGSIPLPVELISFNGRMSGINLVSLDWTTLSEYQCSHFEVSWSTDAESWQPVGKVAGHGTTQKRSDYHLQHQVSNTGNYYKLVQVDEDGSKKEFPIIFVLNEMVAESGLPYPNPADNFLRIKALNLGTVPEVMDVTGNRIVLPSWLLNKKEWEMDISALEPGLYILKSAGHYHRFVKEKVKH